MTSDLYSNYKCTPGVQRYRSGVDNPLYMIIISITQGWVYCHLAPHGHETKSRSQNQSSRARGLFASSSRAGQGRTVFKSRVFRPPRLGSGQIRDATPSAKRGTDGEPVGSPFRLLAALVLSSASCIRAGRLAGTHGTEAGTETSAQAQHRSARVRPPSAAGGFVTTPSSSGCAGPRQIWYQRSSTQHRARFDAQSKKTSVNEDPCPGIAQQDWVARYEQLRRHVLGRCQGISSSIGLAVFFREGAPAWMRVCSRTVTPPARVFPQADPANPLSCDVRNEAVLILAGILLGNKSEANPCKPMSRR